MYTSGPFEYRLRGPCACYTVSMTKETARQMVVAPGLVAPRHEVNDPAKYAALVESMELGGWQGRPVLVYEYHERYEAITGSHRIAAAQETGTDIPVVVLPYNDDTADLIDEARASDDVDASRLLGRVSVLAGELMLAECTV